MTSEVPKVTETGRYTAIKAAQALGLCRKTIYNKIAQREIKTIRTRDHSLKISGQELLRYWNTH